MIREKGKRTIKKYYLEENSDKQSQIYDFIKNIKLKYNYNFDLR